MRPASLLWLFSSLVLLGNAIPIPGETSDLTNTDDSDDFEVDPAGVDRRDLDETVDLEKRVKDTTTKQQAKPPAKQQAKPPSTPGKTTTAKTSCAAKPGGKGKRAEGFFTSTTAPKTITIKLEGKEFVLTKFKDQGLSAVTYTVEGGHFAKTPFEANLKNFNNEVTVNKDIEESIASGRDENCNEPQALWLITKKSPGKRLTETKKYLANNKSKTECPKVVEDAVTATKAALKKFHDKTGRVHGDISQGNILFNDEVTEAFLIDFGVSNTKPNFPNDTFTTALLNQAFPVAGLCPK